MQNHIENHHPFPDESSSGKVGMSFSCDSDANGLYTLSVLFKKHTENHENKHTKAHFFYAGPD